MKVIQKKLKTILNNKEINSGFSLVEVIIAITLISIFLSGIFFGFSTMIRIENISKNKIYEKYDEINYISERYYIKKEYE